MPLTHATVQLSRRYDAPVEVVFALWTNPEARKRWETLPDWGMTFDLMDMREGGEERLRLSPALGGGSYEQRVLALQPNRHILLQGHSRRNGRVYDPQLISLAFAGVPGGCLVTVTVQIVSEDSSDIAALQENCWEMLLESFAEELARTRSGS